ncbi:SH3 domain-containing C40 family peptidase [Antarcticibacterium sp. 1MA-6-2]|uniref:C40 family peptidase n=1 Tax=Antarcticibacterium sp. 1MA-6-2 TaxID=2908210 RepID=UPI00288300F6|nr:SH3 domain-containing C40 family peptidase [Antarcticibacterium sp. 1MA-6-2]
MNVYKKSDNWYLIQTPDDYLAWVDSGGVELLSDSEYKNWKAAEKLIYLEPFGFSYKEANRDSERISDVVAGNIFELQGEQNNFYQIKYPDGRVAFVEKQNAKPYDEWLENVELNGESLVDTSKDLMGLPYLWGGTSSKGVDCSGYTKTVFFLNGLIIPRDASQQIATGEQVDSTRNFENLIPGDLLFFGRPATDSTSERVIHVGMWIGDNKFIHSMGDVHISNMDQKAEDFDEYNYNRYLRSKRVAGEVHDRLIYLKKNDIFNEPAAEKAEEIKG